jgi:hypothetical protein
MDDAGVAGNHSIPLNDDGVPGRIGEEINGMPRITF